MADRHGYEQQQRRPHDRIDKSRGGFREDHEWERDRRGDLDRDSLLPPQARRGPSSLIVKGGSSSDNLQQTSDHHHHHRSQQNGLTSAAYEREERVRCSGFGDAVYISNLPDDVREGSVALLLGDAAGLKIDHRSRMPMIRIFDNKDTGFKEAEVMVENMHAVDGVIKNYHGMSYRGRKLHVSAAAHRIASPVSAAAPHRVASPVSRHRRSDHYGFEQDGFRGRSSPRQYRGGEYRSDHRDHRSSRGRPSELPPFDRHHHHHRMSPPPRRDYDGPPRNNPNIIPREGDWICAEPTCGNLNFARRSNCNSCSRPRHPFGGPLDSAPPPRGFHDAIPAVGVLGPPPMGRGMIDVGPPPEVWERVIPHGFHDRMPPPMDGRFADHPHPGERGGFRDHHHHHEMNGHSSRDSRRHSPPPREREREREFDETFYQQHHSSARRPHSSSSSRPRWEAELRVRDRGIHKRMASPRSGSSRDGRKVR